MPREVEVWGVPVGRDSAVFGVFFFFPVCAKDRPSSAESGKLWDAVLGYWSQRGEDEREKVTVHPSHSACLHVLLTKKRKKKKTVYKMECQEHCVKEHLSGRLWSLSEVPLGPWKDGGWVVGRRRSDFSKKKGACCTASGLYLTHKSCEIQGTSQRWAKGATEAHSTWGAGGHGLQATLPTGLMGVSAAEWDRRERRLRGVSPGLRPSWEDTPLQAPYSRAGVRALWSGAGGGGRRGERREREGGGRERGREEGTLLLDFHTRFFSFWFFFFFFLQYSWFTMLWC